MALDMTTALTIKAKFDGLQQLGGLNKGLQGVSKQSNAAATAMGRLKGAAAGALGAMRSFLPVLGVGAMAKFAKDNIDAADAMSKMSQRTGVAAPTLDKFRKVAELSDTSIDGLGKGFKTLASNMYDAQTKGTGPAADAFDKLGIAITDSNGKLRESDQVMLDIADKFQQMADGPEKAALAADLFGAKIGDELIPLLNSGGDAVRNMGTSLTQEFADKAAAFNDRLEVMQEKLGDLGLRLTEALLPALEKLVGVMEGIGAAFSTLPQPVQDLALGFAAIAVPVAALAIPLGGLVTVFGAIGTALATIGPILAGIPALIAGWAGAIGPLLASLGSLGQILIGVFSGPVGWIALAAAAGVAIYAFRDQIGAAFQAIGQFIADAAMGFKTVFIDPVIQLGQQVIDFYINTWTGIFNFIKQPFEQGIEFIKQNFVTPIQDAIGGIIDSIKGAWAGLSQALSSPFEAAATTIRGVLNTVIGGIESTINGVINAINNLIQGANNVASTVGLPSIPTLQSVSLPRFADGGVVTGPTMALVGEGGEPEYIVPQSKAGKFAANWMAGVRGAAAIPRFAEGGVVVPASANVNIQTGPVTQMNGTNYVTTQDLSRAVQAGVNQTLSLIAGDGSVRRQLGMA